MHRILFVTYGDWSHASSRTRALEYKNIFESWGWKAQWVKRRPFSNSYYPSSIQAFRIFVYKRTFAFRFLLHLLLLTIIKFLQRDSEGQLILYFQKEIVSPNWLKVFCRIHQLQVVYDIDDAIHLEMDQEKTVVFSGFLNACNLVICSTPYLAKSLLNHTHSTPNIILVPTPVKVHPRNGHCLVSSPYVLGWIGSPSTQDNLDIVFEALSQLKTSNLKVELCGVKDLLIPAELGGFVTIRNWTLKNQQELLNQMDYGLAPLKESDWNNQKGGYKINLYSANGIPTIGSPVGVNRDLMEGMGSYICEEVEDWKKTLRMLDQHELKPAYESKAKYAFEYASNKLSYHYTSHLLKAEFEKLSPKNYE